MLTVDTPSPQGRARSVDAADAHDAPLSKSNSARSNGDEFSPWLDATLLSEIDDFTLHGWASAASPAASLPLADGLLTPPLDPPAPALPRFDGSNSPASLGPAAGPFEGTAARSRHLLGHWQDGVPPNLCGRVALPRSSSPALQASRAALLAAAYVFLLTEGAPTGRIAQLTGKPFFFLLDTVAGRARPVEDIFGPRHRFNPSKLPQLLTQMSVESLLAVYVVGDFSRLYEMGALSSLLSTPYQQLLTSCLLTLPIQSDGETLSGLSLFKTAVASMCFRLGVLVAPQAAVATVLALPNDDSQRTRAFSLAAVAFAIYRDDAALDVCLAQAPNPYAAPAEAHVNLVDVLAGQQNVDRLAWIFEQASCRGDVVTLWQMGSSPALQPFGDLQGRVYAQLQAMLSNAIPAS